MKRFLSAVLVLSMVLCLFSGCKKKQLGEAGNNGAASIQVTDDSKIQAPPRAPVGKWDIPIPEINPLGAQGSYFNTSYERGSHQLDYIEDFIEFHRTMNGEVWVLQVGDTSETALASLAVYAEEIGAEQFSSQYGDRLTFSYIHEDGTLWWGDALRNESGYDLIVVKQPLAPIGREMAFQTGQSAGEDQPVSFLTKNEGNRFQSATIRIPDGKLELRCVYEKSSMMTREYTQYSRELSSEKCSTFILDDLPQINGYLEWELTWQPESKPSSITFQLDEILDIPVVNTGDELGGLKVCGVPFGEVTVQPASDMNLEYEDEYSMEPNITPEGDSQFWLPAGHWNVVMATSAAGLNESITRFVPVNSGEMTVVTLPDSYKSSLLELNRLYAPPEDITGGIEVIEAVDQGEKATVSLVVDDPKKRDVFPTKENTTIIEGGQKVDILDISRQVVPPSVVLVLDSSGSMSKEMDYTLEAAKEFVSGLPDKSFIKVIDFDTTIKVLDGETKEEVIQNLSKIKAEGSTKLFDAALDGVEMLKGRSRPALVVFADGADSSVDGQGVGSSSTKEEVLEVITAANIPLYTIAFGAKPDQAALMEFASASGGQYFSARDEKALKSVFTAINGKFGNSFVMTYKRPTEAPSTDTPVVSMVIDASASMDTDPAEEEGCGYRIDKVKNLFHDFVLQLPEECLMQLTTFQTSVLGSPIINTEQITTKDKANILQGIGETRSEGGTPIMQAVRAAFENIRAVPSNNKVIVYLTDAALEVDEEEKALFEELLSEIREQGITVLWSGMGVEDKEEVFKKAAELSGGRYVISEDAAVLKKTLDEILTVVKQGKESREIPLLIDIQDRTNAGEVLNYAAAVNAQFSAPAKSGKAAEPDLVKISAGTPLKRYSKDTAQLVTGTGVPSKDTILTQRMEFGKKSGNKAMELSVLEAFYFSRFKGLAPYNRQFLALQLDLKNTTADKIEYLIPSITSHFYVNVNNEGMYPASDATWLTGTPLSVPGDYEVRILPGKDKTGLLMFLVPDVPINQLSLHFYDTANGHIEIPLTGIMNAELLKLDALPQDSPVNITDAFSIDVTASKDIPKADIYEAPQGTSIRVVEAEFQAKVQALLDINPSERLYMQINTASGPLLTKMSGITSYLPFGFMKPRMLGPGSFNKVRMAYPIANALLGADSKVFGDVDSGRLLVSIKNGAPYGTPGYDTVISGDGFKLRINQLTTLGDNERYGSLWAAADVTFIDEKDQFGTLIPSDFFLLVREGYDLNSENEGMDQPAPEEESPKDGEPSEEDSEESEEDPEDGSEEEYDEEEETEEESGGGFMNPDEEEYDDSEDAGQDEQDDQSDEDGSEEEETDGEESEGDNDGGIGLDDFGSSASSEFVRETEYSTQGLLYGLDEEFAVFDSGERRGFVLFTLPEEGQSWRLKSRYMENLDVPLLNEPFASNDLLVDKLTVESDEDDFDKELEKAVNQAILQYDATKSAYGGEGYKQRLGTPDDRKNNIPVPAIVYNGVIKMNAINTAEDAIRLLQGLRCVISQDTVVRYAPEAVVTQGWGSQFDLANLALKLFAKAGLVPKDRSVALTQAGKEKLMEICGAEELLTSVVPGILYKDDKGNNKIFVIPFMKDISELEGLVYLSSRDDLPSANTEDTAAISVFAKVEYTAGSAAEVAGDIGSVLGGGEGSGTTVDYIELLQEEIPLTDLSKDAVEIGFMRAGTDKGICYGAALSTINGLRSGSGCIDTGEVTVLGTRIEVTMQDTAYVHERTLAEGEKLDGILHTLAANLPDLTEESAGELEKAFNMEYKAAKNPNTVSAMRWYGRNILNRFINTQSMFDREAGESLGLTLGRLNKPRCIMVTSSISASNNKIKSSIDLMQASNQCHNGDESLQAAYNIMSGLFVSSMESSALTGEKKLNYAKLWDQASSDTSLICIGLENKGEALGQLGEEKSFPEHLRQKIEETENLFLITDKPIQYEGQKRWAWLEINPNTYDIISVFDTGEHGAMAEFVLNKYKEKLEETDEFVLGAFVGGETAVWAVASTALRLSDYKQILAEAKAMAEQIGESILDDYQDGYKAGVEAYFKYAGQ